MSGKLKAVILLGLLYVLGVMSGIAWQKYHGQRWPRHPEMYAERRVERLKRKLDLTPAQVTTIKAIFQKAQAQAAPKARPARVKSSASAVRAPTRSRVSGG